MDITAADLRRLAPTASGRIVRGIVEHQAALPRYGIDTALRLQHFLAQTAHESDGFRTTREYASGEAYEGRRDLGNVEPGDGRRYRGRGLIQITGRANSRAAGQALGQPYEAYPEQMEAFPGALLVSLWFWRARGLDGPADGDDVAAVTRLVNGGLNGLADRKARLAKARTIWPEAVPQEPASLRLRQGATGPAVEAWQETLRREGLAVARDGVFGPASEAATRALQSRLGLAPDGIVGPALRQALDARGSPSRQTG